MKRGLMKLCKAEEAIMRLPRRIPLQNAEHEKKRCDVVLTSTSKLWAHSFQFATPQDPLSIRKTLSSVSFGMRIRRCCEHVSALRQRGWDYLGDVTARVGNVSSSRENRSSPWPSPPKPTARQRKVHEDGRLLVGNGGSLVRKSLR